jgi:hypothetical protein
MFNLLNRTFTIRGGQLFVERAFDPNWIPLCHLPPYCKISASDRPSLTLLEYQIGSNVGVCYSPTPPGRGCRYAEKSLKGFPPALFINANRGLNLYRRLGPRRGTPHPRWETPRVLGLWAVAGGDGNLFFGCAAVGCTSILARSPNVPFGGFKSGGSRSSLGSRCVAAQLLPGAPKPTGLAQRFILHRRRAASPPTSPGVRSGRVISPETRIKNIPPKRQSRFGAGS